MARNPEKTEQVVVWCRPRVADKFARFAIGYSDRAEALEDLLDAAEENPGLVSGYFE